MDIGLIIILSVIVLLLALVLFLVLIIRKKLRDFSREAFGTSSLQEGLQNQREILAEMPRSVSSMTKIYLPQIQRDFPEFNLQEYTQKAENLLEHYLMAVADKKPLADRDCSDDLKNQVKNIINDLKSRRVSQHFSQIVIHNTQISKYNKNAATVEIVFQSAVEYIGYSEDENGKLISGDKSLKTQTVYEICLVYVQDIDKLEDYSGNGVAGMGINCPNCGAPIKNLGSKFCEYCGTGIKEINIYSWNFNRINEKTTSKKYY